MSTTAIGDGPFPVQARPDASTLARSAEDLALARFTDSSIISALRELPRDFRVTVYLADVEGYSYREIAAIMGCPTGTVMSRLHRARSRLRSTLRDLATEHGIAA